jgi:MoxR-like ATPase
LRETPEGKASYELYEAHLNSIGINYATCPLPKDLEVLADSVRYGALGGVILYGAAGTGKSILAERLSNAMGAPMLSYCIQEGTSTDDLLGTYAPADGGGFVFKMGVLLKAFTEGWQIRLDEINFGSSNLMAQLNPFFDESPIINHLGVDYHRHKNFVAYCTCNPGYEGTSILNTALKSRFAKVFIPELTENEFCARMSSSDSTRYGSALSVAFYKKLFEVTHSIEAQAIKMHESVDICLRNAQQLSSLILIRPLAEVDFINAFHVAYTFNLALDNKTNMSVMERLMSEESYLNNIKALYKLYDFKIVPTSDGTALPKLSDILETEFVAPATPSGNSVNIPDFSLSEDEEKAAMDLADELY